MFEKLEMAPPDPILGLSAAFREDPNPNKINLGVGVYKDETGQTPVMACVQEAERRMAAALASKAYLPIEGSPEYGAAVRELLFGADSALASGGRAATIQAPGGTGALRVAGDFLSQIALGSRIWLSDPTWVNHGSIFAAAGLESSSYPYYDAEAKTLRLDALLEAVSAMPEGDIILLHGCCHNPTGIDPTPEQWERIGAAIAERKLLPLVDFAYQGLANGIEEDTASLKALLASCDEMLIASSFSKNFGLYRERVGALTLIAAAPDAARRAFSHLQKTVRSNYSNPPAHGGAIVTTILGDAQLRAQWVEEVAAIRNRIKEMRSLFVDTLKAKGVSRDFSFITTQNGMFSFSGLTREQVETLRREYAIYIVGSGRINVAGMTLGNMDALCEAIAKVL